MFIFPFDKKKSYFLKFNLCTFSKVAMVMCLLKCYKVTSNTPLISSNLKQKHNCAKQQQK